MAEKVEKEENEKLLMVLKALKQASREVETNPAISADDRSGDVGSPLKALLELETGSEDLLSGDPNLSTLSKLLSHLKSLAASFRSTDQPAGGTKSAPAGIIGSILHRRSHGHEISRVAGSIGSEIQSWIDREIVDRLISALRSGEDDERAELLIALEARVSRGFDRGLQDLLLRSGSFAAVESAASDPASSDRVRELSAEALLAMVRFNKAVFVGEILTSPAVPALVSMPSAASIRALCGLIASIKSPLVDEIHAGGEIPRIIALLSSLDLGIRAAALECCLEIGYYGRKEAIDAMLEGGLIRRLLELQRSELGGALIEMDGGGGAAPAPEGKMSKRILESRPFASCVARFAIQADVGEGLRQREKRAFKLEVVRRLRESARTDAGAATVLAEVLWGSTP